MNNLEMLEKRLKYMGGVDQESRMIHSKYQTFLKALLYSYQAVEVQKLNEDNIRKALINPDQNKVNYDDKIISIDYQYNFHPGDIFRWVGTNSYWIIYLPELTEDAYFRAQIRRCRYQIYWVDMDQEINNRKLSTYAYIRGPIETTIDNTSKSDLIVDNPNNSLEIYIPNNDQNKKHFKRYQRFMFNNKVWEVQSINDISVEGVIIISAKENYENSILDNEQEQIVDGFYISPEINEDLNDSEIVGEQFIKPLITQTYKINDNLSLNGKWNIIPDSRPVKIEQQDNNSISIKWDYVKSGSFTLQYVDDNKTYEKMIIVESLF